MSPEKKLVKSKTDDKVPKPYIAVVWTFTPRWHKPLVEHFDSEEKAEAWIRDKYEEYRDDPEAPAIQEAYIARETTSFQEEEE